MQTSIQAFSVGLFTATIILGVIYLQVEQSNQAEEVQNSSITEEDASSYLEDNGFVVINSQNYEEQIREKQQLEAELNDLEEKTKTMDEKESESTVEIINFEVETGMTLNDIASELNEMNIIDDAQSFNQFMEENGYSREIQLGEFELHSDLSYEQIAELLTR